MMDYREIRSTKDVKLFESKTNCLHDGYITSVSYCNEGIDASEGYTEFDFRKTSLKICVLVTSLEEKPTVELYFRGVSDWQIVSGHSEILDSVFSFEKEHLIVWADAYCNDDQIMKDSTFVAATQLYIGVFYNVKIGAPKWCSDFF